MEKIYLRALNMNDLEWTHKWHSDRGLYDTLVGPYRYVSFEAEEAWLRDRVAYSNQEVNLMICLKENDQPIGMVAVREIDWIARKGHLSGIFIAEIENQQKGYGTYALRLMLDHCFLDLNLNKIFTYILRDNTPSLSIFENCGFKKEGLLRQHTIKNGEFKDVVLVGLCADQYFQKDSSS